MNQEKGGALNLGIKAYKYSNNQIQGPKGTIILHQAFGKDGLANNQKLFKNL